MSENEYDELENIADANDIHARHQGERRGNKIGKAPKVRPSINNRAAARSHKNKITLAGGEVKIK